MGNLKAVIVQCGQEEYALPVDIVISVEKLQQVNPIPHLPEYMLGLMKIRGELVPFWIFNGYYMIIRLRIIKMRKL
ncbi:chemotaxis protein CheW [Sporosarcina thermotolerans]|nr:chemotaxis protein CheW [Sporosarcina thermotolerans]WHT47442.1 chemotaxis protein CheW [Sporosarcina thermotolerans]